MAICSRCEKDVNGIHTCTPKSVLSEYEEAKEIDDARRYREWASDK